MKIRDKWGMGNESGVFIDASHQGQQRDGFIIIVLLGKWGTAVRKRRFQADGISSSKEGLTHSEAQVATCEGQLSKYGHCFTYIHLVKIVTCNGQWSKTAQRMDSRTN